MGLLNNWTPDICVQRVWQLDLDSLKARGVHNLILDLDNTLTPWRSYEIPGESVGFVLRAKEKGFKLCLLSNAKGSRRLRALAAQLAIPFHRGILLNAKPCKAGFLQSLASLQAKVDETAMIGDQIFTDIWGAKRMGMLAIKVEPMSPKEFIGTKISRLLERLILRRYVAPSEAGEG